MAPSKIATKVDLQEWVFDALRANSGNASITDVAKYIWEKHEEDLRKSGDLFFTWQYDMRWAAQALRDTGICKSASLAARGRWELAG